MLQLAKKIIHRIYCIRSLASLYLQTRFSSDSKRVPCLSAHLALLPPHPEKPFGSRGDQAMALAAIVEFRKNNPAGKVSIITSPEGQSELELVSAFFPDINSLPIWGKRGLVGAGYDSLDSVSSLAVIGADVMDGYYWPLSVLRTLNFCERARSIGVEVGVMGFSFNASPSCFSLWAFNILNPAIRLFCRDAVSLDRVINLTSAKPQLVADAAFSMPERKTQSVIDVECWCNQKRQVGLHVVGFNLHNMLFDVPGVCAESVAVDAVVTALEKFVQQSPAAVLFIPHDYRGAKNDKTILQSIYAKISSECKDRFWIPDAEFLADELKALSRLCDVVLTGRMHLAIAALGSNVPVGAIAYQGKFEGLLKHFDISKQYILQPQQLSDPLAIYDWVTRTYNAYGHIKNNVSNKSQCVINLSKKNFEWMV